MSTLPRMRSLLRRAAVLFSSVVLIFFWSCERHSPEELGSHGDHGDKGDHGHGADHAKSAGHGNSGGLANEHGHDHSKPEAHTDGHDHGHDPVPGPEGRPIPPQAIPPVAGSPAQFFPGPAAPVLGTTPAPSPR